MEDQALAEIKLKRTKAHYRQAQCCAVCRHASGHTRGAAAAERFCENLQVYTYDMDVCDFFLSKHARKPKHSF